MSKFYFIIYISDSPPPGLPSGRPALRPSPSPGAGPHRPRRGLLQPHHALSGQTDGRATRHPAFSGQRGRPARLRLQLNQALKGTSQDVTASVVYFLFLCHEVVSVLRQASQPAESLVSLSMCPGGPKRKHCQQYEVVYSLITLTSKHSIASGTKVFIFETFCCNSVLLRISFHRRVFFNTRPQLCGYLLCFYDCRDSAVLPLRSDVILTVAPSQCEPRYNTLSISM